MAGLYAPFNELTRDKLSHLTIRLMRPGGGSRPELRLIEIQGSNAVVKDYRASGWLLRSILGPWLLDREERIYQLLEGVSGVPRLVGRLDRHALITEHIAGRSCADYADGELPAEVFEKLQRVVEGIHARGVVHCDIKNRGNIIIDENGQPYIVDFASAFTREGGLSLLRRFAFERFRLDDLRGVIKAKLLVGQLWNAPDAEFAFKRSPAEYAVRLVRDGLRKTFKLLTRQ